MNRLFVFALLAYVTADPLQWTHTELQRCYESECLSSPRCGDCARFTQEGPDVTGEMTDLYKRALKKCIAENPEVVTDEDCMSNKICVKCVLIAPEAGDPSGRMRVRYTKAPHGSKRSVNVLLVLGKVVSRLPKMSSSLLSSCTLPLVVSTGFALKSNETTDKGAEEDSEAERIALNQPLSSSFSLLFAQLTADQLIIITMDTFEVKNFVSHLLKVNNPKNESMTFAIPQDDIIDCLEAGQELVRHQPIFLELDAPMNIAGDIHGQYNDLLKIFRECGYPSETNPYLFLGDYVDRGRQQLETICLLIGYKLLLPENFFILRGNHECASINREYGFYHECKRRYSIRLYEKFQDFFSFLPLCALISKRMFCMHGGISPDLHCWSQLSESSLPRPIYEPEDFTLASDLLWSDPAPGVRGWALNNRGVSFVFGEDALEEFCNNMDIDMIVRAHQMVEDGYEFFGNQRLVTVFSAPNYCGEDDNLGAVMMVDGGLKCKFAKIVGKKMKRH